MKKILILLLCLGLVGCVATASKMNRISLGMSKTQVVEIMGNPNTTKAIDNEETLEYLLSIDGIRGADQYWITLLNGKVVQYGRAGDFETAMPQDRREYNIKSQ